MENKKIYIAPNLTIVKAETIDMIAASPIKKVTDKNYSLGDDRWPENGHVEDDADLPIYSKSHNAWDSWEE